MWECDGDYEAQAGLQLKNFLTFPLCHSKQNPCWNARTYVHIPPNKESSEVRDTAPSGGNGVRNCPDSWSLAFPGKPTQRKVIWKLCEHLAKNQARVQRMAFLVRMEEDKTRYVEEYHQGEDIQLDPAMIQKYPRRKATAKSCWILSGASLGNTWISQKLCKSLNRTNCSI